MSGSQQSRSDGQSYPALNSGKSAATNKNFTSEKKVLIPLGFLAETLSMLLEHCLVCYKVVSFPIWCCTLSVPLSVELHKKYGLTNQSYFFKSDELPLRLCLFWITRRLV